MDVHAHSRAADWLAAVGPLLDAAESENNLMLGLAGNALRTPDQFPQGIQLWSVVDSDGACGAALLTPPHNLLVCRQPAASVRALAGSLHESGLRLPGVTGDVDTARLFVEAWSRQAEVSARVRMSMRLHDCVRVIWSERTSGEFRAARAADIPQLAAWRTAFERDVFAREATFDAEPVVRRQIDDGALFVWTVSGQVVSVAAVCRPTRRGIAVAYVYTPPEFRGRGYATSCVAELTARQLRAGREFCCLYTDLANPTSNAIYARIGYRPVCDCAWWEFGGSGELRDERSGAGLMGGGRAK